MSILLAISSIMVIGIVLLDGFEALLLPRRVLRKFRLARYYYVLSWQMWKSVARAIGSRKRREAFLSVYGPLSIVVLFAIWASGLIVGFAVLQQSLDTPLNTPGGERTPIDYFYMSGVTMFTLGYGDVTPASSLGRIIAVIESGVGFGFLAAVIGYLPVLYSAFSRRELPISLLDARAGSPPTATEALVRAGRSHEHASMLSHLSEWEHWAAEVLESHLSFPVLTFYRSQHDNQSWLAALTAVLDTCAIIMSHLEEIDSTQATLTFAMARHAAVDLAQIYRSAPLQIDEPRITPDEITRIRTALVSAGYRVRHDERSAAKMNELRAMYEPFVLALGRHFVLDVPRVIAADAVVDNWQTSAWMRRSIGLGALPLGRRFDDHDE